MKKSKKIERSADKKSLIRYSVRGAFLGVVITMAIIFIMAALMLTGALPESLRDTFILVAVILGATVSGLYCAGRQGGGVVVAGLTAAAFYVVLILLGTMLFRKNSDEAMLTIRIIIAAVAGGCFGGVLKLHRKRKKSKLRR
ncbi:MAG: TIGR04086 family membrane protein [Firmicutes bacterium HGW-Firmicutes-16]|nr:MAG: TIGR04086 family membrane protein [Firmicutes bacterium HGW-Firmicutes-16]